jgi:hypothetical protein
MHRWVHKMRFILRDYPCGVLWHDGVDGPERFELPASGLVSRALRGPDT